MAGMPSRSSKASGPSLILSDWNMPEMNGIDFLKELKARKHPTPLGFVTSESTPDMRAAAVAAGAVFLLTKPFTTADVRHAMETAGFKPQSAMRGTSERTIIGRQEFGPELMVQVVGHLVNQQIMVRPGPALPPGQVPGVTCTWIDDENKLVYGGLCEMSLAAALGAAIGLRPSSAVSSFIKDGGIPEELQPDCREVFNVMSRAFTDAGSIHVRLAEISFAPQPAIQAAVDLNANATGRMDFKMTVGEYGAGRLALVSMAPNFIVLGANA